MDLVNSAREIQKADETIRHHVGSKLSMILEQMRFLQDQAARVLQEAEQDSILHRAKCNFKKRPGKVYHLYRQPSGATYFSMLSAEDWGGNPPDESLGSYRLEADMSWTPAEKIATREQTAAQVGRLLGQGASSTD